MKVIIVLHNLMSVPLRMLPYTRTTGVSYLS